MDRAVICFTRAPVLGQTKTRVMPLLSGEACAELHAAFLRDVPRSPGRPGPHPGERRQGARRRPPRRGGA